MNSNWMLGCLGLLAALPALGMTHDKPAATTRADLPALIDTLVDLVPGPADPLKERLGLPMGRPPQGHALSYQLKSGQRLSLDLQAMESDAHSVDKITMTPVGDACINGHGLIEQVTAAGHREWRRYPFPWYYKTVIRGKTVDVQESPKSQCIKAIVINKAPPPMKVVPNQWPHTQQLDQPGGKSPQSSGGSKHQ